jgi:hypothetical protein
MGAKFDFFDINQPQKALLQAAKSAVASFVALQIDRIT